MAAPRSERHAFQTFDKDRFHECRDCGWTLENRDVLLADTALAGALDT